MDDRFIESREAVMYAREALKNGSMTEARQWAERAANLAPKSEDPWLILAAVAAPRESVDYIRKALEVNPNSQRAKQGMEWAMQRLGASPKAKTNSGNGKQGQSPARSDEVKQPKKRSFLFPAILIVMGCVVFLFAAWSAATSPVLASILNMSSAPVAQQAPVHPFAQVYIAKPSSAAMPVAQAEVNVPQIPFTATPNVLPTEDQSVVVVPPTDAPVAALPLPTNAPIESLSLPTDMPSVTPVDSPPQANETPGVAYAQIVADTPTSEYVQPTAAPDVSPAPVASSGGNGGEHWIDVDLTHQRLYAYEGDTIVNTFIVSTGVWQTPTVTGKFKIWIKLRYSDMSGPGYYLPNVPYVMYFYKDYGLHGTYWHNNFGTPMSHGCVNLSIPDAEWLYNFSSEGTVVNVHN